MDHPEVDWCAEEMRRALLHELEGIAEGGLYTSARDYQAELGAPEQFKCLWAGSWVSWELFGHVGTQAFAIGRMQGLSGGDESPNFGVEVTPPCVAQKLMDMGTVYTYCQVAVVVVPEILFDEKRKWIRDWVSERAAIRRVCMTQGSDETEGTLARRLTAEVLAPWYGICTALTASKAFPDDTIRVGRRRIRVGIDAEQWIPSKKMRSIGALRDIRFQPREQLRARILSEACNAPSDWETAGVLTERRTNTQRIVTRDLHGKMAQTEVEDS